MNSRLKRLERLAHGSTASEDYAAACQRSLHRSKNLIDHYLYNLPLEDTTENVDDEIISNYEKLHKIRDYAEMQQALFEKLTTDQLKYLVQAMRDLKG